MTKETEVTPAPEPVMASRDREDTEIVETVELEQPEVETKAPVDDARADIYARHKERRDEEIAESEGENSEIPVESDDSVPIIEATEQNDTTDHESKQVQEDVVEIKIGGMVRSVPRDKVEQAGGVENYQIRIAAKEQMERNAHERTALAERQQAQDERERLWNEQQAALPSLDTQQAESPDGLTPPDSQTLEDSARRYQEAVYDDDADAPSIFVAAVRSAADAAVKEAMKGGQPFDEAALRKRVKTEMIADERQAKIVKAGQSLIEAHPELQTRHEQFDQRMFDNINDETVRVERENPTWEPEQVCQEAYDRISKWKGNAAPQPETMSDKQARKQAMAHPRTGTQRHTPPPPPPRATRSDYVTQQRKARGLE